VYVWLLLKSGKYTLEQIEGVALFVASKPLVRIPKGMKEVPKPIVHEPVPLDPIQLQKAENFIHEGIRLIKLYDENNFWPKFRRSCTTFYGKCPYQLICEPNVEPGSRYREDLINTLFAKEDPLAHLAEEVNV
jgi:hypothetical protein